jgi:hypothetical protein
MRKRFIAASSIPKAPIPEQISEVEEYNVESCVRAVQKVDRFTVSFEFPSGRFVGDLDEYMRIFVKDSEECVIVAAFQSLISQLDNIALGDPIE